MEKVIKFTILSFVMFLYSMQGRAFEPTVSSVNPIGNSEVKQAQASVYNFHHFSSTIESDYRKSQELNKKSEVNPNDKSLKPLIKSQAEINADLKGKMLDSVRQNFWSGNYPPGEKVLEDYKKRFGMDANYLTEKARLLALTNQSKAALNLLDPLLKKNPKNPILIDIRNYAIQHPEIAVTETASAKSVVQANSTTKPKDLNDPLLQLAGAASEKLDFKKAAQIYRQYLQTHPKDKDVTLQYIRSELWAANYAIAEEALSRYQKALGSDEGFLTEKARLLTLTNKSNEALTLINALLKKYPQNVWLPNIKAYALKHPNVLQRKVEKSPPAVTLKTAQILENSAIAVGKNPALYLAASQAYSSIKQQERALLMINKAICLAPWDMSYLKVRAEIGGVLNKPEISLDSYRRMLFIKPNDRDALLGIAQSYSAQNRLTDAANAYFDYLTIYPTDKSAWIAYTYIKDWMGDSVAALRILQTYCQLFGKTSQYVETKARVLAEAERPTPALCIVNPRLRQKPNDVELNHTRVVALYYNNQPVEMFKNLAKLKCLTANNRETKDLTDFVTTPYRTNANLDLFYSKDVDSVEISHAILTGQIFITPLTNLLLIAKEEPLSANVGSGLNPIQGGRGLTISEQKIGINQQVTPKIDLEAVLGNAHVTYGQNEFVYKVAANLKPSDPLLINLLESRDYYDVSARAVSLGVMQQLSQVTVNWQPCLQRYLFLQSYYSTFSDTNTMWYTDFSPKVGLWRGETLNFDLGVNGQWFGFSKKLNDGYYNPKFYQYYSINANGYLKQSTNVGYGFSLALGQQKDETFTSFKFAGDAGVVGYFGIYKDWMLVLSAGISNRGRSIGEQSRLNSNYKVWAFDAAITRRF